MLDGNRGKMGVRRQIPANPKRQKKVTEYLAVFRRGLDNRDYRLRKPPIHHFESPFDPKGNLKNTRVSGDPQKCQDDSPRQTDGLRTRHDRFHPSLGPAMYWSMLIH